MAGSGQIAAAPISWGVCEVPGWGHQMPPDRVFGEMAELGLQATEAGPEGFLPRDAGQARDFLDGLGLTLVGGFVPAVLHEPATQPLDAVKRAAQWFATAKGQVLVLAADTAEEGYEGTARLDDRQWDDLLSNLDAAGEVAAEHGLLAVLHPHFGTVVERRPDIERVLEGSDVALCLDTGHQLIGGVDPVRLAGGAGDRIRHVQFKDVSADLAEQVRAGRLPYKSAVHAGMYRPLGAGDVDVPAVVRRLGSVGFAGWYVLEQDLVLDGEPPPDAGPKDDVRRSLTYLRSLLP